MKLPQILPVSISFISNVPSNSLPIESNSSYDKKVKKKKNSNGGKQLSFLYLFEMVVN